MKLPGSRWSGRRRASSSHGSTVAGRHPPARHTEPTSRLRSPASLRRRFPAFRRRTESPCQDRRGTPTAASEAAPPCPRRSSCCRGKQAPGKGRTWLRQGRASRSRCGRTGRRGCRPAAGRRTSPPGAAAVAAARRRSWRRRRKGRARRRARRSLAAEEERRRGGRRRKGWGRSRGAGCWARPRRQQRMWRTMTRRCLHTEAGGGGGDLRRPETDRRRRRSRRRHRRRRRSRRVARRLDWRSPPAIYSVKASKFKNILLFFHKTHPNINFFKITIYLLTMNKQFI